MLNWFFIALAAPFLWVLVNLADKYLVINYFGQEKSPGSLVLFSSLIGIIASLIIGLFTPGVLAISLLDKALQLAKDKKVLWTEGGQGKDSLQYNTDSTGYDLSTTKIVVEAHQGLAWAESAVGQGSTFYVELPR